MRIDPPTNSSEDPYFFHNTELNGNVAHARHAVALDERRSSFTPTLWSKVPPGCDLKQLWFPGVHADVGGGYADSGLSDVALEWMIEEATAQGLCVSPAMTRQIKGNPMGELHDSVTSAFRLMRTQPRAIPEIASSQVHRSALERNNIPPIAQAPYHPTTILAPGGAPFKTPIYASDRWGATGLYLEKGTYALTASGQWIDGSIPFDPTGSDDGGFHLGELLLKAGSALGKIEKLVEMLTRNEQGDLTFTKRVEDAPWFALIGVVANEKGVGIDGTPKQHQTFVVGRELNPLKVEMPGYLHCFANDAWDFYFNNRGSVELTVHRLT